MPRRTSSRCRLFRMRHGVLDGGASEVAPCLNKQGTKMAATAKLMIGEAERRFPIRIRIAVPPQGFGARRDLMAAWLDDNCGANGWAMTPAGLRGVINDAVAVYFCDVALAGAFVARWCRRGKAESVEGAFRIRDDMPSVRRGAPPHRTPE